MALHDVDKSSGTRAKPTVSTEDVVANRMSHNTMANTYRTAGLGVVPRMRFMNGLILTYDSENRVSSVYGYIPEVADYPINIIANAGEDVFVDILGITAPVV